MGPSGQRATTRLRLVCALLAPFVERDLFKPPARGPLSQSEQIDCWAPKEYLGFAMKASLDGFTLIEMLVVMAIVAILVLLAVPTFQGKIIKDQIVEAGPLADVAKKKVAAVWEAAQTLPPDNPSAGLPGADKMVSNVVSSVAVEAGAIHVTFGNRANQALQGKILTFRPGIVEDSPSSRSRGSAASRPSRRR